MNYTEIVNFIEKSDKDTLKQYKLSYQKSTINIAEELVINFNAFELYKKLYNLDIFAFNVLKDYLFYIRSVIDEIKNNNMEFFKIIVDKSAQNLDQFSLNLINDEIKRYPEYYDSNKVELNILSFFMNYECDQVAANNLMTNCPKMIEILANCYLRQGSQLVSTLENQNFLFKVNSQILKDYFSAINAKRIEDAKKLAIQLEIFFVRHLQKRQFSHEEYSEETRNADLRGFKNKFLSEQQNIVDFLSEVISLFFNKEQAMPILQLLNDEMMDLLHKTGRIKDYESYQAKVAKTKEFIKVGNKIITINQTRFEWDGLLANVLHPQLEKHGFKIIDDQNRKTIFYGFVAKERANGVIEDGDIFLDNPFAEGGLIHGKYTHAIQLYIISKAIDDGAIKLPDGYKNLQEVFKYIIENNMWRDIMDVNDANLLTLEKSRFYLSSTSSLHTILQSDICGPLSDYLSDKFYRNLAKISKYTGLSMVEILIAQVGRGANFDVVKKCMTTTEYYLWRDEERASQGKERRYTKFDEEQQKYVLDKEKITIDEGVIKKTPNTSIKDVRRSDISSPDMSMVYNATL